VVEGVQTAVFRRYLQTQTFDGEDGGIVEERRASFSEQPRVKTTDLGDRSTTSTSDSIAVASTSPVAQKKEEPVEPSRRLSLVLVRPNIFFSLQRFFFLNLYSGFFFVFLILYVKKMASEFCLMSLFKYAHHRLVE
jgi:hypothetical protein